MVKAIGPVGALVATVIPMYLLVISIRRGRCGQRARCRVQLMEESRFTSSKAAANGSVRRSMSGPISAKVRGHQLPLRMIYYN